MIECILDHDQTVESTILADIGRSRRVDVVGALHRRGISLRGVTRSAIEVSNWPLLFWMYRHHIPIPVRAILKKIDSILDPIGLEFAQVLRDAGTAAVDDKGEADDEDLEVEDPKTFFRTSNVT